MLRDAGGLYLINGNSEYKVDSKPFFKSHLSFQNSCENFMKTLNSDEFFMKRQVLKVRQSRKQIMVSSILPKKGTVGIIFST